MELSTKLLRVCVAWLDVFPVDDGVEVPSHGLLDGIGLGWVPFLVACLPVLYTTRTPLPINLHAASSQNTIIVSIPVVVAAVASQPRFWLSAAVGVFYEILPCPQLSSGCNNTSFLVPLFGVGEMLSPDSCCQSSSSVATH
jgi:hypothetical protein